MAPRSTPARIASAIAVLATLGGLLAACGEPATPVPPGADRDQVDAVEAPANGACRALSIEDVSAPTNAGEVVDCASPHTAQTYAVGDVPDEVGDAGWSSAEMGAFAYATCTKGLQEYLGADESTAMRTVLSWAWFRPSEKAWEEGARWYRCDVVGGGEQSRELVNLPPSAKGLLMGRPEDKWLACVKGATVSGSQKIPCSEPHDWRAVTTIKLGEAADPYPGDRLSEVRTNDFCKRSVQAYLNYPAAFTWGYTYFHEPEWKAGNRRSVCWAQTSE